MSLYGLSNSCAGGGNLAEFGRSLVNSLSIRLQMKCLGATEELLTVTKRESISANGAE